MKLLGLLLFIAAVSCDEDTELNNKWLERVMNKTNIAVRKVGRTKLTINGGELDNKVSYSDGIVLGLDSFYRTGDNTNSYNGTHFHGDLHYGFRFLNAVFTNLTVEGKDMSASFRIRNNSIHFSFYLVRIGKCKVRLDALKVEALSKVDFGSSMPEYDGTDVDDFFKTGVLSAVNAYLDSQRIDIEKKLQFLCYPHRNHFSEPRYLAFLEHVFYKH